MNKIRNVKCKDAHNLVHEKTEFKVMHMIFSIRGEIISTRFKFKDLNLELHIFLFISKFKFEVIAHIKNKNVRSPKCTYFIHRKNQTQIGTHSFQWNKKFLTFFDLQDEHISI